MENEKIQLDELRKDVINKLNVLYPSKSKKGKFKPSFVYFNGYSDLFVTIQALINVSILATQGDYNCPPHSKELESDIRKTLELASSLMPFEEGELLDDIYKMFSENDK